MQRMAARLLHDDDLAADAVQETLIQLWHRRWRLGMMKDYRGYCMRTLRNRCIDILRQQRHDLIPWRLTLGVGILFPKRFPRKFSPVGNLLPLYTSQPLHEIGIEIGF